MLFQSKGTLPSKSDFNADSNYADSKISPFMAFLRSFNDDLIMLIKPLNLINSWVRTVFILYSYETGYFFSADLTSNGSGISDKIASASCEIISSGFFPDELTVAFYWVDKIASKVLFVSFLSLVMSAFEWSPNTSGSGY